MKISAIFLSFIFALVSCKGVSIKEDSVFRVETTSSCTCGQKNGDRIVGGNLVTKNEYPWMAAICYGTPCNYNAQFCGGSLINDWYILTAAHCLVGVSAGRVSVSLGDHNLDSTSDADSTEFTTSKIIIHEGYNSGTMENDIALIKLSTPVEMTSTVSPVCLPPALLYEYGNKVAYATGWGLISEGGTSSRVLREVEVQVLPNNLCARKYGQGVITSTMLCASNPGKDSCQGDSGGPLVYAGDATSSYEQIGVVSWGYGCADGSYPGVYTRANQFVDWIEENTADAVYCQDAK